MRPITLIAILLAIVLVPPFEPGAAHAAPPGRKVVQGHPDLDPRHQRQLGQDLAVLFAEQDDYQKQGGFAATGRPFQTSRRLVELNDGLVTIDAVAAGEAASLLADLTRLGLRHGTLYGRVVSGRLPVAALDDLAYLPTLAFVRAAHARTRAGSATSQGDVALRADLARSTLGVDGTGITVGVLSDSFDCAGTELAIDIASDDLPTATTIVDDSGCPDGNDEGRAMAQLIHDVAPGAAIVFHTGLGGQATLAAGINTLADEIGVDILVDDTFYLGEPMLQDGIVAQAADAAVAMGVTTFSAAGNNGRRSYEQVFRSSGVDVLFGGDAHDFDPGPGVDVYQSLSIPVGDEIVLSLQWDAPFFSVSGAPGAPNDLDICLMDDPPSTIIICGQDLNVGQDAVETLSFFNDGTFGTDYNLVIEKFAGPVPGFMKYILFENVTLNEYDTASSTVFGHSNAATVAAVGAAFYYETPEFGTSPALPEPDSSAGGTAILLDIAGLPLGAPEVRQQPRLMGPDGGNTTFFGADIKSGVGQTDQDNDPNFFGSSAAAAHLAGVAALLKDRNGALLPAHILAALESTASDMDDPATGGFDIGFDYATGYGLGVADAAGAAVPECGNTVVEVPEECDDGNSIDDDACGNDCLFNICGDGIVHPGNGEACDDGNSEDNDFCRNDCQSNFCGDGRLTNTTAELLLNGDFETGALAGWKVTDKGSGTFLIAIPGAPTPIGNYATAANAGGGSWYAVTDSLNIGTHALEQAFTVPATASTLNLAFEMFVNDQSGVGPIVAGVGLDYSGPANQHARVDVLSAGSEPFDTGAGVLNNYYLGVDAGSPPHPYTSYAFDIIGTALPGGTYELRFAEVDNQFFLHQGVDNVSVTAALLEECDDGNNTPGDGCDAECLIEGCPLPGEITGLQFLADAVTLQWDANGADSYDVLRADGLPLTSDGGIGVTETCVEPASADTTSTDGTLPGGFYFYLVRGRNGCGNGTYGHAFPSGTERTSSTCP